MTGRVTGRLTVLCGPSGVGKGSVIAGVRRRHPAIWLSVSATTRPPRDGEVDGASYHFVSDREFDRMAEAGELLEHASYAGYRYGTPKVPVLTRLEQGVPALLELEVQGARQVREAMPAAQLVFLSPPSFAELVRRLSGRGTEDPERVARRLQLARTELAARAEFDHVIVNDDLEQAVDRLLSLMVS